MLSEFYFSLNRKAVGNEKKEMRILTTEKVPYLLAALISFFGIVAVGLFNMTIGDNYIEYRLREVNSLNSDGKIRTAFECRLKNISKVMFDTLYINYNIKPDSIHLIDRFIEHKLVPIPPASLHSFDTDIMKRMTLVTIWNFYPDFEYVYTFTTETSLPHNWPTVNVTPETNRIPVYLVEANIRTFFIKNVFTLGMVSLFLLIITILMYLKKIRSRI